MDISGGVCANAVSGLGTAGSTIAGALQFFAAAQCLLHESWPRQASVRNESCFNYIVIGGGTAGSVVAARLSELPHATVLLLEAGGDPPLESIIPGFRNEMKKSRYDWNFTTVNDYVTSQALQHGSQVLPRGKMLGGTGSINDMIYSRGNPADYEEWAKIAGDDWSWENVLEYYKKTEHLTDERIINNPELRELHGYGGEIEVTGFNDTIYATEKLLEGFQELGFEIVKDMTAHNVIGAGRFSHTIREGKRDSSFAALLNKASERNNLFILKDAVVTKIHIENHIARGVKVLLNDHEYHFCAHNEVIVTAGTYNTAKLLLLSGLGPKHHLESVGVHVVKDLPVGDNLQDHVMVLSYLAVNNGTCNSDLGSLYMDTIKYLYDRTGSLSWTSDLAAYITLKSNTRNIPDFAIYPTCIPASVDFYDPCTKILGFKPYICEKLIKEKKDRELLSLAVVNLKPKSRGRVRLQSSDPMDDPLIYAGTFSDPDDLAGFPEAMSIAWSLADTSYFKAKDADIVNLNIQGCEHLVGVELQKCWANAAAMSAWHSAGTAAMGTVVDSKLRVHGVRNLRVADASVMPTVPRGNTNAPVVMIAEKASDYIKESYRRSRA